MKKGTIILIISILVGSFAQAQQERDSILKIFQTVIHLNNDFLKTIGKNDTGFFYRSTKEEYSLTKARLEKYQDDHFDTILPRFVSLTCEKKDITLFNEFLKVLIANENSADEAPSFSLAEIFVCQPDFTLNLIDKCSNKKMVLEDLSYGFENLPVILGHDIKNYTQLKKQLASKIQNTP